MAVYWRHKCGVCGGQLINDEKQKRYVHADVKQSHNPIVVSEKMEEARSA